MFDYKTFEKAKNLILEDNGKVYPYSVELGQLQYYDLVQNSTPVILSNAEGYGLLGGILGFIDGIDVIVVPMKSHFKINWARKEKTHIAEYQARIVFS